MTFVEAIYGQGATPEENENPLVAALPNFLQFDYDVIKEALAGDPNEGCNPRVLSGDAEARELCYELRNRRARCFVPLSYHLYFQETLDSIIRAGYMRRNPRVDNSFVQEAYRRVLKGDATALKKQINISHKDPEGLTLIGCSGMGKSFTIENVLSLYQQVIDHVEYGFLQVVYLRVEYPHDGKETSLCHSILAELDNVLKTDLLRQYEYGTPNALVDAVVHAFKVYNVGVLVIDEIQNILVGSNTARGREKLFNFIVRLSNTSGVPLVFIGTPKAYKFIKTQLRVARRFSETFEMKRPLATDRIWQLLLDGLWDWRLLDKDIVTMPAEVRNELYDKSKGITDLAVRLFFLAQMRAIRTYRNHITPAVISSVYTDSFQPMHALLNGLGEGKTNDDDWSSFYEQKAGDFDVQADLELSEVQEQSISKSQLRALYGAMAKQGFAMNDEGKQIVCEICREHPTAKFDELKDLCLEKFLQIEGSRTYKTTSMAPVDPNAAIPIADPNKAFG